MEGPHLADHYNTLGFSEVELRLGNRLWGKDYFNHLKEGNKQRQLSV